jgi:putative flippase GtrA
MSFKTLAGSFISKQFLRFLLVGGIAALANFLSRFAFQAFFPYTFSVALAFSLGTVISFILNRSYTFAAYDEKAMVQFIKFILIAIVGIALAAAIAWLCMAIYKISEMALVNERQMESIAHIIAIFLITFYNFLAMKYFSFKRL